MMEHRLLGATGLRVSRLGLGLAALGRPGYITLGRARDLGGDRAPEAMYARAATVLDAARAAGIRYVDAARSYGRAEAFLATWLAERAVAPDELVVGSKWGYRYTAAWAVDAPVHEEKELSLDRFRLQLGESRALLGDRLALYQIHSATLDSGVFANTALLAALVAARRDGAVRGLGFTLSGPGSAAALDQGLDARVDGEPVFDIVQATFNPLEPSLAAGLAAAHAAGLGVIVKEAHANGRLTDANDRPSDAGLLAALRRIGGGRPIDQLAVAFALAHPFVDVVLSGAATTAQLASHVRAAETPLDASLRDALAAVAEPPPVYWRTRGQLPWT